ncbi:hypothetical protein WJX73_006702 [Symbiochloris irregularis]|uniref:Uncharacterized protein n=1 Tax=Symbiochloris irregularis TaxID=706552 RepID=A0AAW1P425_9CHLO
MSSKQLAEAYERLEVCMKSLHENRGAQVTGLDLTAPLDGDNITKMCGWLQYGALLIQKQQRKAEFAFSSRTMKRVPCQAQLWHGALQSDQAAGVLQYAPMPELLLQWP